MSEFSLQIGTGAEAAWPQAVSITVAPPTLALALTVTLERLRKRRCRGCGHRRIVFALRAYAGASVVSSSRLLCSRCAGLVQ